MINHKQLVDLLIGSLFLTGLSLTKLFLQIPPAYADSFSIIGEWSGSPDCPIMFYKDDGRYVEGNCDNGAFNHIFRGTYSNPRQISLTLTRIDPNHCQTSVETSIQVIDNNHVKYWQGGWDGCGIRTQPIKQDWYRANTTEPSPTIYPSPTETSSPTDPPSTTSTTTPAQKPCLIRIGDLCVFP